MFKPLTRSPALTLTLTLTLSLACAAGCVGSLESDLDSSDPPASEEPGQSDSEAPAFLDTDSNSLYDAVDRDRDAQPDYYFAESAVANALIDAGICLDPALLFLDTDNDGMFDAIDLDCDGQADVSLTPPGTTDPGDGGQPPSVGEPCTAVVAIDGDIKRVDCSSDATGTTCVCYRNDVMVDSCSQPDSAFCSVTDGCCDFGG